MLPRTPHPGSRGLPSNPRPRSRSAVRSRDHASDRQSRDDYLNDPRTRSSSHSINRPERSRTPPVTKSRRPLREDKSRLTAPSRKSDDSASSTPASLFARMKLDSGYAPSHASPEKEYKNSYSTLRPFRKPVAEGNPLQDLADNIGTGEAIWNRVATVASNLTVSVSKAWTANLTTFAGEETPPGQESRLTRAIKAYHLEKARDITDLPSWLFDESERHRLVSYNTPSRDDDDDSNRRPQSVNEMPKSRGLRDVYDAYRPETPIPTQQLRQSDDPRPPSKATDRLKALRDAKRAAANSTRRFPEADQPKTSGLNGASKPTVTERPRVGLPSGPRRA